MDERPALQQNLDADTFQSFYYLKEELVAFCKEKGLPATGGKLELTSRIAAYLSTGTILPAKSKTRGKSDLREITLTTLIEPDMICSEVHRAFFKRQIGESFSFFVPFQKWLKANTGKSYAQAIEAYYQIVEEKKKKKTSIDRQFEYNTYIRDFFAANPGRTLPEAIACWKHKKSLPGRHHYETSDLSVLI